MSTVFVLLFLASLGLLTWGLIAPKSLAKHANKHTKKELTRKHFAIFFGLAAFILLVFAGATAPSNAQQGAKAPTAPPKTTVKAPVVEKKTETETKPVAFSKTSVNDSTMASGTSKVTTAGVNGVETLTYEVTYTDGKQTAKNLVSDTVTTQPITEVTTIGTYVAPTCTNGTYVNSAGNTVCSPEYTNTAPAGATAQCVDGSYSFSQSRSGTCSHHGGVATWL